MTLTMCWCRNISKQVRKCGRVVTKKAKQKKSKKKTDVRRKLWKLFITFVSCAFSWNLGVSTISFISRSTSLSYKISPPMNSPCCGGYDDMFIVECCNVSVVFYGPRVKCFASSWKLLLAGVMSCWVLSREQSRWKRGLRKMPWWINRTEAATRWKWGWT